MSSTAILVFAGCFLGLIQIGVGIAIGTWLRRPEPGDRDADLRRTRSLALELHSLTQHIGSQVAGHRDRCEQMESRLQSAPGGKQNPTTDLVVGVVQEILTANRELQSELHDAEARIAAQAREIESHIDNSLTDPLTKLPNRRALDEQLASRLKDYRRHGIPFSIMMVDADYFKSVNDTFGHQTGDEVLVGIGQSLQNALRRQDFVARFGGEEFAVIFNHSTLEQAQLVAQKACDGLDVLQNQFSQLDRAITASGGLASIEPGEEIESLMARADEALYLAKHNGRDRICLHDGIECRELADAPELEISSTVSTTETLPVQLETSAAMNEACDDLRAALLETASSSD